MDYSNKALKISNLIDYYKSKFPQIKSDSFWEKVKVYYRTSDLSYREVFKDIIFVNKYKAMFNRGVQKLPSNVLDDSILLLGPALSGKSSVGTELSKQIGLDIIHMEDKRYLKSFYDRANIIFYKGSFLDKFKSIKQYREKHFPGKVYNNQRKYNMFLIATVLESLREPKIVCVTEAFAFFNNPLMQYIFEEGISWFKNRILVVPSLDKKDCSKVLTNRFKDKYDKLIHGTIEDREVVQKRLINTNDYLDHCLESRNFSYVLTTNGKTIENEVVELRTHLEKQKIVEQEI